MVFKSMTWRLKCLSLLLHRLCDSGNVRHHLGLSFIIWFCFFFLLFIVTIWLLFYVCLFVCLFLTTRHVRSQLPDQESNPHPLRWKVNLNYWTARESPRHF